LLIDPGPEYRGGPVKRFDSRMSPAHARLAGLANQMEVTGRTHGGSGGHDLSSVTLDIPGAEAWPAALGGAGGGGDDDDFGGAGDEFGFGDADSSASLDDDDGGGAPLTWDPAGISLGSLPGPSAQRKAPVGGKWSKGEDEQLRKIVGVHGPKNWKRVAELLGPTRTDVQCLHRWNKVRGRARSAQRDTQPHVSTGRGRRLLLRAHISRFSDYCAAAGV